LGRPKGKAGHAAGQEGVAAGTRIRVELEEGWGDYVSLNVVSDDKIKAVLKRAAEVKGSSDLSGRRTAVRASSSRPKQAMKA
jgi:hypothetical protein